MILLLTFSCASIKLSDSGSTKDSSTADTSQHHTAEDTSDTVEQDTSLDTSLEEIEPCNGHIQLCDLRVDEVSFPGTHNSMSNSEDGWLAPNQNWNVRHQLNAGVRALNLDTYWYDDTVMLCHGYCELGKTPLVQTLFDIKGFLQEEPNTILIISFQDAAEAGPTIDAFEAAGLFEQLHEQALDEPWPTLQELLDANTNLIVFAANHGGSHPAYHAQWDYWIDTPYQATSTNDFTCEADRGNLETATLLNVNHFITFPIALPDLATTANQESVLQEHLDKCAIERDHHPNQILVDFIDLGKTLDVIDTWNMH